MYVEEMRTFVVWPDNRVEEITDVDNSGKVIANAEPDDYQIVDVPVLVAECIEMNFRDM